MANEIHCAHRATGKTLYALIRNATGSVWNGTIFTAYATANLWTYTVYFTEQGTASRYYTGTFPSVAAGIYNIAVYERPGGSAAEGDPLVATGSIYWDGSVVSYLVTGPSAADYTTARAVKLDNLDATISSRAAPGAAMALAANAVDAAALATDAANEIADALLDRSNGIETSYTLRQAMRLMLSALAAKLSGAETTTINIRNVGDTKNRITATVDANGNRSAVTLDAS